MTGKPLFVPLSQVLGWTFLLVLLAGTAGADRPAEEWVGKEIADFSLPSQLGRLVTYQGDYYGQHHLVLTFFPAAFTPV